MYSLYREHCEDNNISEVATESIYRQIFCSEFKLSFFQPKKDLCDICYKYDTSTKDDPHPMEYQQHIKNKELARKLKATDKEMASQNSEMCVAVFDLQQILPVPKSDVGLAYYKLKLSAFNFTVFNLGTKECQCFMWHECIAKRGSSEIGSCLLHYVEMQVKKGVEQFSFFSDNCGEQNRNKYLFSLYNHLTLKHSVTIRDTYLERGHTQNEGDSVHSVIERAARNIPVYTPNQWISIVRLARRTKPYEVVELFQSDVYNLNTLQEQTAINFDKGSKLPLILIKMKMAKRYSFL